MGKKTWDLIVKNMEEILEVQSMTTHELLYNINIKTKQGSTSHTLGQLLRSRPQFKKVSYESVDYGYSSVLMPVWGMNDE